MKRTLLISLCILLPLLAFAGSHSLLKQLNDGALPGSPNRAYRVHERVKYEKNVDVWDHDSKITHHYPNSTTGKPDSLVTYEWESNTNEWMQFMVLHFEYNNAGRVTALNGFMQFMPGMVIHMFNSTSVYDNQNRLIHYYMNMFNGGTFTMDPFMILHITYSGQNIASFAGWMNDEEEPPYWISTFEHDNQGRVITEVEQSSTDSTTWVNAYRTVNTYHPNDQSNAQTLIEYIANSYPTSFGEGMYYLPGMPAQYLTSKWNGASWDLDEREVYTWQATTNRLLTIQNDYMEQPVRNWVPQERETFSYDTHGNIAEVLLDSYYADSWSEYEKEVFTWFTYGTAIDDNNLPAIADLKLSAYPMPFNDIVNIDLQSSKAGMIDVDIYNLKGQQVNRFRTLPGQNISWNGMDNNGRNCASGIYLVKAKQDTAEATVRIIKLK